MKNQFRRDGFSFPYYALGDSSLQAIRREIEHNTPARAHIIKNPHLRNGSLLSFLQNSKIYDVACKFVIDPLFIENIFIVTKYPFDQFVVPLHQDGINDNIELDPDNAISMWVAITPMLFGSGELLLYPRTHVDGYKTFHKSTIIDPLSGESPTQTTIQCDQAALPLNLDAGQCCVFDPRLFHESRQNQRAETRIAMNLRLINKHGYRKSDTQVEALARLR